VVFLSQLCHNFVTTFVITVFYTERIRDGGDIHMTVTKTHPTHLSIDHLTVNPRLGRCLPATVAWRYHALPIAKDNDHFTVAMANPYDETACRAIAASLGSQPYVVKGSQAIIDQQLAQLWPDEAQHTPLNILVYHQDCPFAGEVKTYAKRISHLINGKLTHLQPEPTQADFKALMEKAGCDQDLVIFGEQDQSLIQRILAGPSGCKAAERLPTSVLIARQPRWPLNRILLITRGYISDNMAVDWLVRLAQPSRAKTTVLALIPTSPGMYQRAATTMPHGLADWLATDTPLGHQLRRISQQLANWDIEGRLHFRQGTPSEQIQVEVADGDYDLIVMAADPDDWWERRLLGEVVSPLLHKADRPVLVVKPTTA
jgi:nucleotide-binding universal stress UspA family protein